MYMQNTLDDDDVYDECSLAIEYQILPTFKRIDFFIVETDTDNSNNAVVVELKQWDGSKAI